MTIYAFCWECDWRGVGDKAAEKHTKDTKHATITTTNAHPRAFERST